MAYAGYRSRWLLGLLAVPVLSAPAFAQAVACSERETLSVELEQTYDETLLAFGMTPRGQVVELHVSPDSGTWTMLITFPDGTSCVGAYGSAWQQMRVEQPKKRT